MLKLVIFLYYQDLPAHKIAEILSLATAFVAHLRSRLIVFALLIPMPRFKSINFC